MSVGGRRRDDKWRGWFRPEEEGRWQSSSGWSRDDKQGHLFERPHSELLNPRGVRWLVPAHFCLRSRRSFLFSGESGLQTWSQKAQLGTKETWCPRCGDSRLLSQNSRGREEAFREFKDSLGYVVGFRWAWAAVRNPASKSTEGRLGAVCRVIQALQCRELWGPWAYHSLPVPGTGESGRFIFRENLPMKRRLVHALIFYKWT